METLYKDFYRNLYLRTGGFIPAAPLDQCIYPGDFFQILNGQIIVLGNIFSLGVVDIADCKFQNNIALSAGSWTFSHGVTKPYSGRGAGNGPVSGEFEFSKQVLAFEDKGSFIFRSSNPESLRMQNWSDIQQQLIIKLTQSVYSFREVYVVTESASVSNYTLAIADAAQAELELATDAENFGLTEIFGHNATKTIQSRNIAYYHREEGRKPLFFKAKKLAVQQERVDEFTARLHQEKPDADAWKKQFYDFDEKAFAERASGHAHVNMLDLLKGDELNPQTALNYFTWNDMNLDDIEQLFVRA